MVKVQATSVPVQVQAGVPPYPFNGTRFIKVRQASEFLNVSQAQLRLLCDSGDVHTIKTLGGHRLIDARSLYQHAYGLTPEESADSPAQRKQGLLIGMVRVSSRGQSKAKGDSDKSSLQHQEDRIRNYAEKKYGVRDFEILRSIGSGLSYDRKELLDLIKRMISQELKGAVLILTSKDRLCRFGWELIQYLADFGGVTIEYCCADDEQTENESLTEDVLSVLTHFTAKVSGNKARKILKVVMDEKALLIAYKMKRKGASYEAIAKRFDDEGRTDQKNRRYSPNIIRKNLLENRETLENLVA